MHGIFLLPDLTDPFGNYNNYFINDNNDKNLFQLFLTVGRHMKKESNLWHGFPRSRGYMDDEDMSEGKRQTRYILFWFFTLHLC